MNTNTTSAETVADQARASATTNQTAQAGPSPQQGPANANFDTTTTPAADTAPKSKMKRYIVGGVAVCALGVAAYLGYKRYVAS